MPRYRLIPLNINGLPENNGEIKWDAIAGKPATFPPDSHSHEWNAIAGKPTTFPPDTHSHEWNAIAGKPATFPPDAHNHGVITSSSAPVSPSKGTIWNELDNNNNFLAEWWWNGSLWMGKNRYIGATGSFNVSASINGNRFKTQSISNSYNIYIYELVYSVYPTGTNNSTNYWQIILQGITPAGSGATIASTDTTLYSSEVKPGENYLNKSLDVGVLLNFKTSSSYPNIQVNVVKVNSPTGSLLLHASLVCAVVRA